MRSTERKESGVRSQNMDGDTWFFLFFIAENSL
jgi:hypothetical protein